MVKADWVLGEILFGDSGEIEVETGYGFLIGRKLCRKDLNSER